MRQRNQLQNLVDYDNYPDRLKIIDSVAFVPEIVDALSEQLCAAPLEAPCCLGQDNLLEVNVPAGRYRYVLPGCSVGQHAFAIVVQTVAGTCHLFASTLTETPGPLQNEAADVSGDALKILRFNSPRTEVG